MDLGELRAMSLTDIRGVKKEDLIAAILDGEVTEDQTNEHDGQGRRVRTHVVVKDKYSGDIVRNAEVTWTYNADGSVDEIQRTVRDQDGKIIGEKTVQHRDLKEYKLYFRTDGTTP